MGACGSVHTIYYITNITHIKPVTLDSAHFVQTHLPILTFWQYNWLLNALCHHVSFVGSILWVTAHHVRFLCNTFHSYTVVHISNHKSGNMTSSCLWVAANKIWAEAQNVLLISCSSQILHCCPTCQHMGEATVRFFSRSPTIYSSSLFMKHLSGFFGMP